MRRLLPFFLVIIALLPCGVGGDDCDEAGAIGCSTACHLGCTLAPMPEEATRLAADLTPVPVFAPQFQDLLLARPQSPELPPPRA